jgi:Tol biopolymer transport system component/PKD repeat protein
MAKKILVSLAHCDPRVAPLVFMLALACFFGLPDNSRAQGAADQFAMVVIYPAGCSGACSGEGGPTTSSLVVMAGDGSIVGGVSDNPGDGAPAWSADGARIAFGRNGDIMVVNFPGGVPVNLTNHPADDVGATWSPDGSKIAFATNRDVQAEIYVMNADGTGTMRLTNSSGVLGAPAWSPDGTRIAFDCEVESGNRDICAVNADGSGFVRLTSHPAVDSRPAWSPNGAKIAFGTARYSADPTGFYGIDMQLATMNPDGTVVSQVGVGTSGFEPSWSPNGDRLVFTRMDPCYYMICPNVYVVKVDGSAEAWLAWGHTPAWRPVFGPPAPGIALSPGSLAFGSQLVGTTSNPLTVSLTNAGTTDVAISSIVANGDFVQTDNCGSSVAAGASCTIIAKFTPTATGARSGALTITNNAAGSPHTVSLSGTGISNKPPVASFIANCTGLTCGFNGSASSDSDGTIASYAWSFGDGTTGSGATVSHAYAASGTYSVTLTVTDNGGTTAPQSANVTVSQASMHVGDLDRNSTKQGNNWTAIVTVTIHGGSHNAVSNATVSGSWSTGGTGSCVTNASGKCTVSKSGISKNIASVTFTVGNVTHATLSYKAAENHESDGDSNGTSIAMNRP